jgi:hypothetical protein
MGVHDLSKFLKKSVLGRNVDEQPDQKRLFEEDAKAAHVVPYFEGEPSNKKLAS